MITENFPLLTLARKTPEFTVANNEARAILEPVLRHLHRLTGRDHYLAAQVAIIIGQSGQTLRVALEDAEDRKVQRFAARFLRKDPARGHP